jgi:hypothetical protein
MLLGTFHAGMAPVGGGDESFDSATACPPTPSPLLARSWSSSVDAAVGESIHPEPHRRTPSRSSLRPVESIIFLSGVSARLGRGPAILLTLDNKSIARRYPPTRLRHGVSLPFAACVFHQVMHASGACAPAWDPWSRARVLAPTADRWIRLRCSGPRHGWCGGG